MGGDVGKPVSLKDFCRFNGGTVVPEELNCSSRLVSRFALRLKRSMLETFSLGDRYLTLRWYEMRYPCHSLGKKYSWGRRECMDENVVIVGLRGIRDLMEHSLVASHRM